MGSREPIVVEVLGRFAVRLGDEPVDLPPGLRRVVLATLAMSAGRAVSVDRLTDIAWGDDLPANARRSLQTHLTRLRQVLGPDAIATEPAGYALRTAPDNVDALRFRRLVERAGNEPDVERELLIEALRLWRGDAFEDLDSDRLGELEGRRLAEQWLTAIERRIDLDLADRRAGEVIPELRELTARFPLREPLWVRLLVALAQTGRQAEALEQYEQIRARIADELGVDPGTELQRIFANLLDGSVLDPTAEPTRAATTASTPTVPRQLPADIARFVGRAALLDRLDEVLGDGTDPRAAPIVAVHGTGGVGKTSLVVHWAHRVAERFPDGQLYLNLRGYGPGEPMTVSAALDTLLRGLGVQGEQLPTGSEAAEHLLRSMFADRRMLVILDNAHDADHVRPLLPGTGQSRVVVTSRSQLRGLVAREGAARVGLDQLDPAESVDLLEGVLAERGIAGDESSVAELGQLCGHLPLALAVAAERASRQPDLELGELVAELREERERLDALDLGEESASLRAVFAWSYQALDPDVAAMFRLLGLYPASDLSLPGAAALAGTATSRVRRLLDRLVDGNLLQQRRPGRYELHDLLHTYAAELAENDPADDRSAALGRLLDWYLHSAANAWRVLWANVSPPKTIGPPVEAVSPVAFDSRAQALGWFESERASLIAAVRVAADRGQHATVKNLGDALWYYLSHYRAPDDLLTVLHTTADSARRSDDLPALAKATLRLGTISLHRADHEAARAYYERSRELYELAGDPVGHGRALSNLGTLAMEMGRFQESADYCERAIEWLTTVPREHAQGLNNLAVAYLFLERHRDAYETARRALDVGRGSSLEVNRATSLDTIGQALLALGHAEEAVEHLRQARRLLSDVGARWEEGAILTNLGRALSSSGDDDAARAAWTEALSVLDELGAPDVREYNRSDLRDLLAEAGGDRR
jgi:DNA-binding SARP family transcriptional activator/tetratricopeptide (TPR) repeat protein